MKKQPDQRLIELFDDLARQLGATGYTVTMPRICDRCKNEDKEAFPFIDIWGAGEEEYEDLCNDCFEELMGERYD